MDNRIVNIALTLDEVNYILAVLSECPYKDVCGLIHKVKEQGEKQLDDLE